MMIRTVLLVHVILAVMCAYVDCGCVFESQVRAVGEEWHPSTFGTCVNCTCEIGEKGDAEVRCINTVDKCPELNCDSPKKDPNMCCPYCEVQTGDEKSSSSERTPCVTSDGRVIKDGDSYASNTTGLRPTSEDQCVMCVCQNGQSLCHLKTCAIPDTCSALIESPDECCPVCADCSHVDGLKKNGTTWHPTIALIGEIDCITCSCMNGQIHCEKNCTPDHELPCRHPKKPNGECCKTCPLTEEGAAITPKRNNNNKDKKNRKRDRKGKRKGKGKGKGRKRRKRCRDKKKKNKDAKCKKRRKRPNKRDSNKAKTKSKPEPAGAAAELVTVATARRPGVDLDTLCLKRRAQLLMYKVQTEREMAIAFDDIKAGTVDVYMWTIMEENDPQLVSYAGMSLVSSPVYRRSINSTNVIGTIGNKQYRKFKKRLKEKLEKCKLDCDPKLFIRIVQRVKVNLLKFGDECKS